MCQQTYPSPLAAMSLMLRLQAFKQRRKSGHGRKLGQAKATKVYVDAPVLTSFAAKEHKPQPEAYAEACAQRRMLSVSSISDVLPSLDYTNVEKLENAPSLVSSHSFSSGLTYAEEPVVDDGLTAWGLPKVVGGEVDDDDQDFYYDCEETLHESMPLKVVQPSATQLTAQKTLCVCYTALLVRHRKQALAAPVVQETSKSWLSGWL